MSTLCILLTSSPENENSHTAVKLSQAALAKDHRVKIFLMSNGVYHVLHPRFLKLIEQGVEVTLCGSNAAERGIEEREGVTFGSQYDLSVMAATADSFITFH
ncbi:MAG: DsrE family protein [Desulfobulbaceae bacterium]|nr:DsrE family protein [Desulfobulbaceae bacterium]